MPASSCNRNAFRSRYEETEGQLAGLKFLLVDPIPDRLKCSLCHHLMRNPIQTQRGEVACETCYFNALGSNGICPIDKEPIVKENCFKDKFKSNEIRRIKCFCSFKENGCPWKGTVGELENHQLACTYQPPICYLCKDILKPHETMINHLKDCDQMMKSSNGYCIYANIGCKHKVNSLEDHIRHIKDNSLIHFILQNNYCQGLSTECENLRERCCKQKQTFAKATTEFEETVKTLYDNVSVLKNTIAELEGRLQEISSDCLKRKPQTTDDFEDISKLSSTVAEMDKKIADLDLKQQLYENSSYNGKVLWKIDKLNFRMQQAVIGRVTALHSAPCFTEKYGYRFCCRLYLNGDGLGKCTHVSVFFVLMRSEYDNLLQWPFTGRVKFRLINQDDASRSIEESFIPDRFSACFQKPVRGLNVAAGCPMFVSKDDLLSNGFVKDNAMFMEVSVV